MKITELNAPVDEVAMNPTAYAQSIEQGQSQGVRVVLKPTTLSVSDYYKKQASRGMISTYNGYFIVKTEMLPPTDPHVQQVILQMRKERFRK